MKKLLTFCWIISATYWISTAFCGVEPEIKQTLPRTGVSFTTGNRALVYDMLFLQSNGIPTAVSPGSYRYHHATNRVFLELNQSAINHAQKAKFEVTVHVELTKKDATGSPLGVEFIYLTTTYDSAYLFRYQEKNAYNFTGAYWVDLRIVSISDTTLKPFVALQNTITIERYKDISGAIPGFNTATVSLTNAELQLHWNELDGAEEYDLEWTFVDDYLSAETDAYGAYVQPFIAPGDLNWSFRNDATRVTVKSLSYKVPIIGEHGYLIFRVRGVGYIGSLHTHRKEGSWSSQNYGPFIYNSSGTSFTPGADLFHFVHNPTATGEVKVHENTLNWQLQRVFAEEGKHKDIISYHDGALKGRQMVTRISSDEMSVVGEDIYDYQGRKVGSFLPVPAFDNKLKYYPDFNLSSLSGKSYNESDFDSSMSMCERNISSVLNTTGAGLYYSINNPNVGLLNEEYIPDAEQFPFMLTEFMPDGSGRIRRQGGVGPNHQLGSDHDTKYYYATPDQEELDRLFGNSIGYGRHYQKNMVVDPNGQVSVSYLDLQGRTVATALAGTAPSNVTALTTAVESDRLTTKLESNLESDVYADRIEIYKTFLVPFQADYKFSYGIEVPRFTDSATIALCFDCVYDLQIQLINECGENILDGDAITAGIQTFRRQPGKWSDTGFDVNCESPGPAYRFTTDDKLADSIITINLPVGSYTLLKTLYLNDSAREYYYNRFMAELINTGGLKSLEQFKNELIASGNFGVCINTCEECNNDLPEYATYLDERISYLQSLGVETDYNDTVSVHATWLAMREQCDELCDNNIQDSCTNILDVLKSDVSPGGQYAIQLTSNTFGGLLIENLDSIGSLDFNYQYQWISTGNPEDKEIIEYPDAEPYYVNIDGVQYKPNQLTSSDFVNYWSDRWADVLVVYHPEYCQYLSCVANMEAEMYEISMLNTDEYVEALEKGFLNPLDESAAPCPSNITDPYFFGGAGAGAKDGLMAKMLAYYSPDPSNPACSTLRNLWEVCQMFYACPNSTCSEINTCLATQPWDSVTCAPYLDQMWRMFRAAYLSERRIIMEAALPEGCPRQGPLNGKIPRFATIHTFDEHFENDDVDEIREQATEEMLSECDTACMSRAQYWYQMLRACALDEEDSATLISNFIAVCRNSCDLDHPIGASDYPRNRTQRVATPYYSFREVFDAVIMTCDPGGCDINMISDPMPFNHNYTARIYIPNSSSPCIKDTVISPCIENAPSAMLKQFYLELDPPDDSVYCDKCISCGELKDALLEINSEYICGIDDSTLNKRIAVTNRLNQILGYNLNWMDYWEFIEKCTNLDSLGNVGVLNEFLLSFSDVLLDLDHRKNLYQKIHDGELKFSAIPEIPLYLASIESLPTVPSTDSTLLNTCICNKLQQRYANWAADTNPKPPTFNAFMEANCGTPSDQFDYLSMLNVCKEIFRKQSGSPDLTANSTWSANRRGVLSNYALNKKLYVPNTCSWDCTDDNPAKGNPFFSPGRYGNSDVPPSGNGPGMKPVVYTSVSCDSFFAVLDSMQALLTPHVDFSDILRKHLFTGSSSEIATNLSYFVQLRNAFYARYPLAPNDNRFSPLSLDAMLAWLQKYKKCLFDQLGNDALSGDCCYRPNRYSRAVRTLLHGLAKPLDVYGNYMVEEDWNMFPPIPEYYKSILYPGVHRFNITFEQNPYDIPRLIMDFVDSVGLKRSLQLNYTENLFNEAYFGDIVAFYDLRPVRFNSTCDTARYFKIRAIQKVSWGYDTTWMTGHTPNWILMDTCDFSDSLQLCDRAYGTPFWTIDTLNCQQRIDSLATLYARIAYERYLKELREDFLRRYNAKCLEPTPAEVFTLNKPNFEYHYTLYYYDQAGNLLQTVPPAGVNPLSNSLLTDVALARKGSASPVFPAHSLNTRYQYNTLNQLVWQHTPDAGESDFWYDKLGRLVVSRNAEQTAHDQYSYTLYDGHGRITEVGQLENHTYGSDMSWSIAFDSAQLASFLASGDHKQVTRTYYDAQVSGFSHITQTNLRKRVSGMEYLDLGTAAPVSGVYYDYDIHGNVQSLVRYNEALAYAGLEYSRLDYSFDLISGKVNQADYQRGYRDRFIHRYQYDADNRITDVYAGTDGYFMDREAAYFYYLHGPLKRAEYGELKVQGLDYVYTLHGWIKGVNSTTLQATRDPGRDGLSGSFRSGVCRDVMGYNLGYYEGDYRAIALDPTKTLSQSNYFTPHVSSTALDFASPNLYNGNIRHMITALKPFMLSGSTWSSPQAMAYSYDQLNRIQTSTALSGPNTQSGNDWGSASTLQQYAESYSYDPNGNILTLSRNGNNSANWQMDNFQYHYVSGTNKLDHVSDLVPDGNYSNDIDNQTPANYDYDAIGNLIKDESEEIDQITWTVYGKIKSIIRDSTSGKPDLEFAYSPDGHRIMKKVSTKGAGAQSIYTFYSHDAQGNQMAIYTYIGDSLVWESSPIYGSSRIGIYEAQKLLYIAGIEETDTLATGYTIAQRGVRRYELSNHLGNVLVTVSDRRGMSLNPGGVIQFYEAEIVTATDYYPFGMQMQGRDFAGGMGYRWGFGGYEKDNELKNAGNHLSFNNFGYDPRTGRRWTMDKHSFKYTSISPYASLNNNPVIHADPDGKDAIVIIKGNVITVTAKVVLWGADATQEAVTKFHAEVNSTWNASKLTYKDATSGIEYKVIIDIKFELAGGIERTPTIPWGAYNPFNTNNYVEVNNNKLNAENAASGTAAYTIGGDEGLFGTSKQAYIKAVPHEIGHMLGLAHHYSNRSGDELGWENNVMGALDGRDGSTGAGDVDQRNIDAVVAPAVNDLNKLKAKVEANNRLLSTRTVGGGPAPIPTEYKTRIDNPNSDQ